MDNAPVLTAKALFQREDIQKRFKEMLGKKAPGFITSVLQCVASNDKLQAADPMSIYQSAALAATLDLPINQNLGFAYIVPYEQSFLVGSTWHKKQVAQFQMGYKGFIQLAQRSGQFRTLNSTDVREGEIKSYDRLTGEIIFEWDQNHESRLTKPIVGYVSFFKLLNGFEKIFFMSMADVTKHGKKYSKSWSGKKPELSLWNKEFDMMANKTVVKLLLSRFAPLSIEMQRALIADQAVINDAETLDVDYTDNTADEKINKEHERFEILLKEATTVEQLEDIYQAMNAHEELPDELINLYLEQKQKLSTQ